MGLISTTVYDSLNRPLASINPSGLRSTTVYDSAGRAAASIDPSGLRNTTVYDSCCSRPKATIAPTGARTSFTYNALGSQIRTTAPTGAISTTVYDALNRTVASWTARQGKMGTGLLASDVASRVEQNGPAGDGVRSETEAGASPRISNGATPEQFAPLFDRLGISAEVWCRLVKDFGKLFSVVAGQPARIDEHRSKGTSRRYRARHETRELMATA